MGRETLSSLSIRGLLPEALGRPVKRISAPRENSSLSTLVAALVVIATLYLARVVFVPLALALLFSLLLTPRVNFLERIKLPRVLAIALVVLVLVGLIGSIGWKTSQQFVDLTNQLPAYKETIQNKIHAMKGVERREPQQGFRYGERVREGDSR
jgi:predicted PurR-regulated permease PerM